MGRRISAVPPILSPVRPLSRQGDGCRIRLLSQGAQKVENGALHTDLHRPSALCNGVGAIFLRQHSLLLLYPTFFYFSRAF